MKNPKLVYLFEEATETNKKLFGGKGAGPCRDDRASAFRASWFHHNDRGLPCSTMTMRETPEGTDG